MRQVSARGALAAAILALSLVDGGFSLGLAGRFYELNPILRPLLDAPAAFVIVKLGLVGFGVWLLMARDRSRASTGVLVASLIAFSALDAYWVIALQRSGTSGPAPSPAGKEARARVVGNSSP